MAAGSVLMEEKFSYIVHHCKAEINNEIEENKKESIINK